MSVAASLLAGHRALAPSTTATGAGDVLHSITEARGDERRRTTDPPA